MESAFTPLNKVRWMKAFRTRARSVTLRDGRKFKLRYGKRAFYPNDRVDYVWFEPVNEEFAPCGYLRMEKVTDKLWLEESDRPGLPDTKYVIMLDTFLNSDLLGVEVTDQWPDLKGRLKQTLHRGFTVAKVTRGRVADHVRVTTQGDNVFLLKEDSDGS